MLGVAFSSLSIKTPREDPPPPPRLQGSKGPPEAPSQGPSAGVHGSITIPFTNLLDHQNKRSLMCQEEGPEALAPEHEA